MAPPVLQTTGIHAMSPVGRLLPISSEMVECPLLEKAAVQGPGNLAASKCCFVPTTDIRLGQKPGGEQRISVWMGCFLAGRGLIDGGSVDVDFSDCGFYPTYTRTGMIWTPVNADSFCTRSPPKLASPPRRLQRRWQSQSTVRRLQG